MIFSLAEALDVDNTPPLARGNLCLMHNGTVHKLGNENDSDSIRLLQMITQKVAEDDSILGSLRTVYFEIAKKYKYTSLTSVITDGESVLATKCVDPDQDAEYYDLMYAKTGGQIVISQERTWQLDWNAVENGKVAIINKQREISIEKLF
jgi:predicted glutamine amidotransferase